VILSPGGCNHIFSTLGLERQCLNETESSVLYGALHDKWRVSVSHRRSLLVEAAAALPVPGLEPTRSPTRGLHPRDGLCSGVPSDLPRLRVALPSEPCRTERPRRTPAILRAHRSRGDVQKPTSCHQIVYELLCRGRRSDSVNRSIMNSTGIRRDSAYRRSRRESTNSGWADRDPWCLAASVTSPPVLMLCRQGVRHQCDRPHDVRVPEHVRPGRTPA